MKPRSEHHGVETRLRLRAAKLAGKPLLGPEVATALRARLAQEAAREGGASVRRRALFTSLGLVAAALLLIFAPGPGRPARLDFGHGQAAVALLDTGGRNLGGSAGLRSENFSRGTSLSRFLLELVAESPVQAAVRIRVDGVWRNPLEEQSLRLLAGEDLLRSIEWPPGDLRLLVFLSERPIPGELINRRLASASAKDLEREFGCQVIVRDLRRAR